MGKESPGHPNQSPIESVSRETEGWGGLMLPPSDTDQATRILRAERTMIRIRWAGVVFAFVQIATFYRPYPPGIQPFAYGVAFALLAWNVVASVLVRRVSSIQGATRLSMLSFTTDGIAIMSLVAIYTFDPETAIWALIYVIPLEGAKRASLKGSVIGMAIAAIGYVVREVYGSMVFGNDFLLTSISFRMGIGFIIAGVAGSISRDLESDRERLLRTNQRYKSLHEAMDEMGEGFVVVDPPRVLFANEAAAKMSGYSVEELLELDDFFKMLPLDQHDRVRQAIEEALSRPEPLRFETAALRSNGKRFEIEASIAALSDQEGSRLIAIIRDITERKRSQEELIKSQALLASAEQVAGVGSWMWRMKEDELTWSEQMGSLYGLREEDQPILETLLGKLALKDRLILENEIKRAVSSGLGFTIELENKSASTPRPMQVNGLPIRSESGDIDGIVGTSQDLSSIRKTEQDLKSALTRERSAKKRLLEQDIAKSDFLSNVAHELRTPVTSILGILTTVNMRWEGIPARDRKDLLDRAEAVAQRLAEVVDELLDFSQLERRVIALTKREVNVWELAVMVVDSLKELLEGRAVSVDISRDISIRADDRALRRVFENLLSNAVKFSKPATPIQIYGSANGDAATVSVVDEGVGIPDSDLERVFERFYRVDRGDTVPSGTGIGLAIARDLVEAHGGRLWAQNREQGGAIFSFSIPANHLDLE